MARHLRAQGHPAGCRRTPHQGIAKRAEGSDRDQEAGRTRRGNCSGRQANAGRPADAAEGGKRQVAAAAEVDEGRGRLSPRSFPGDTLEFSIFRADLPGPPIPPDRCPAHRFCLRPTLRRRSIPRFSWL
ncbi:protein of unknown function [Cupriavidus taiwanensis]|nr:protein of unknown function [Cupriavidus taiwanensis]